MITVGIDIIQISRIRKAVERSGEKFLKKVYTEKELELENSIEYIASRFAGKEAVFKALRIKWEGNASFKDIEILKGEVGEPVVILHGKIKDLASKRGIENVILSLSYDSDVAVACAIALYNKEV
ncbi:MAG: holo-ACP synthase [Nitrososphaeria archaeon]|nr:holo-ACP synthase [Candidatus Bathyarchaeota archaeon]